ncbi:SLATT domain-containing protein, partial [Terrabacter aerolatus]
MGKSKTVVPPVAASHYAVPPCVRSALVPIGEELARLEETARWSSQTQFEAGKSWQRWNLRLGVPASVLGLFSGGAAYLDTLPTWVVGTGALAGAGLAAVMTILGSERRAQHAKACANTFHDIQDDARRMLLIDLGGMTDEEARTQLESLTKRYTDARHDADTPNRRAYNRARRNLEEGGQQFAIDSTNRISPLTVIADPSTDADASANPDTTTEPPRDVGRLQTLGRLESCRG